jgi:hypothetical protein
MATIGRRAEMRGPEGHQEEAMRQKTRKSGGSKGRLAMLLLGACLALAGLLATAAPALAFQYTPHSLDSTFSGTDSTGGGFSNAVSGIAVDQATGDVYVATYASATVKIFKFNADGVAIPFTDPAAQGSTVVSLEGAKSGAGQITVDNSGGPSQGQIYVTMGRFGFGLDALDPSGKLLEGNFPIAGLANIAVSPIDGSIWGHNTGITVAKYTNDGTLTEGVVSFPAAPTHLAAAPNGDLYGYSLGEVSALDPSGNLIYSVPLVAKDLDADPVGGNLFVAINKGVREFDPAGDELPGFTVTGNPKDIAVNGENGHVYLAFANNVQIFSAGSQVTLPDAATTSPSNITPTSVTINGSVNPEGTDTTSCKFEYGPTISYGTTLDCDAGQVLTGADPIAVSADISGLRQGSTYHYRLDVANANGTVKTIDSTFTPSAPPDVSTVYANQVHADSVFVNGSINPGGAPTTYHVDYGTENCLTNPGACTSTPESESVGAGLNLVSESTQITGLSPATTYHYVVVATNQSGITKSADHVFTTFPVTSVFDETCENAHVRQQTGAALLPDCRAYELVSAANAGGYDVESYLTAGQTPFAGYPLAQNPARVLYGVNEGAIPGTDHPTNHGLDPYVASRGSEGWTTRYVGIPADLPYSGSFASTLAAADSTLDTFAFGGPELCSPCFADGSTGMPVRLPGGELVQGMTGPVDPSPSTKPNLLAKKPLSANGADLVFGSTTELVAGAGSAAIYDRDLATGITYDVSVGTDGHAIPCLMQCTSDGIAELDISADGSHILIGQLLGVDSKGNHYWHLYMNVDDASHSIDLMPGSANGALYDGMTADGSMVYMTSRDQLTGDDTDSSADIFRATIDGGSADLSRVSGSGGSGNGDACTPVGNSTYTRWNVPDDAPTDCSALAIGGGGGVASQSGALYFLSPEQLDGDKGTVNAPNLYLAKPGAAPHFVATLDSSLTGPASPLKYHVYTGSFNGGASPAFIAVDSSGGPSNGDVYVADNGANSVRKYDAEGNLITTWGDNGVMDGSSTGSGRFSPISGLAVGSDGTLYVGTFVTNSNVNDLFEFNQDGSSPSGHNVSGTIGPVGIAVDSAGAVYYVDQTEGFGGAVESEVLRYTGGFSDTPVSTDVFDSGHKDGLAFDPNSGDLYVNYADATIGRFVFDGSGRVFQPDGSLCERECKPTSSFGTGTIFGASGLAVDPANGDIYVDEGNKILRFDSEGQRAPGPDTGADVLSNSTALAIAGDGSLYANNTTQSGPEIAAFSGLVLAPDLRTDNPAVLDSVGDADNRHTADFQVTPEGDFAAFSTAIPFSGADNNGHSEIFRYDAAEDALACASCNPTNAQATGNAEMAPDGLSLTDDGRLFFDTPEPLAPRDLDNREDVYEWSGAKVDLISTGVSQFDSALLSASADGTDAYFFTRDSLVPQDTNGELVKIYDARENGGFPYRPAPVPCKASDECHGAGTAPPPPPNINSVTQSNGGNLSVQPARGKCRHHRVRRHGRCVKPHKRHRTRRHSARHRRNGQRHGGRNAQRHGRGH